MLDRIRASIPALPPAEQRVALLLLGDPRSFASLPVAELAGRAHVSKPTVVRFCRSVGYAGLTDLKLKLAGSVDAGLPLVQRAVDDGDQAGDLIAKVVDNAVAAMLRYRHAATELAFERAIAALAESGRGWNRGQRIEFYGVGSSGIVAQDAQHQCFRLGVTAAAVSDAQVQVMSATMLKAGDCAVISSPGSSSRDLLDVAEIARRQGATVIAVIAVTASASPLARLVRLVQQGQQHVLLAADHPEDAERHSPIGSRLLHLLIVDILATGVALALGSAGLRPWLQEIKKNLRAKRRVGALRGSATAFER